MYLNTLIRSIILFVGIIFLYNGVFALQTNKYNQQWFQYYNQVHFSNKINLVSDVGLRYKDEFKFKSQFITRTSLRFNINDNLFGSFGVAFSGQYKNEKVHTYELRPYQDIVLNKMCKKIEVNYRVRVEEQLFYDNNFNYNRFNFRTRFLITAVVPMLQFSNNKSLNLSIGNELFMNAKKNEFFNQNRILIGPVYKFKSTLNLSVIYNYQLSNNVDSDDYQEGQIIWVSVRHSIVKKITKNK